MKKVTVNLAFLRRHAVSWNTNSVNTVTFSIIKDGVFLEMKISLEDDRHLEMMEDDTVAEKLISALQKGNKDTFSDYVSEVSFKPMTD